LPEIHKTLTNGWPDVAGALDAQGESSLANEVRHFVLHSPRVSTEKERIAVALVQHLAEALDLSRRQVAYYASGERPVPRYVLLALKGWELERKELAA